MSIAERVRLVQDRIAEAAVCAGRRPEEITLVAASKTKPTADIREAIRAGVRAVGENRCQELVEKRAENAYEGASLHFIGHLQQNKLRYLVGVAELIHSVDSETLLREVERRAARLELVQDILLQVNIGGEESKGGIEPARLSELCQLAGTLPHVRLRGLMAIPPVYTGGEKYPYFSAMYRLFVDIMGKKYDNISMEILSMGMSADYAAAISEGATMVRVGSAIFGARAYTI